MRRRSPSIRAVVAVIAGSVLVLLPTPTASAASYQSCYSKSGTSAFGSPYAFAWCEGSGPDVSFRARAWCLNASGTRVVLGPIATDKGWGWNAFSYAYCVKGETLTRTDNYIVSGRAYDMG